MFLRGFSFSLILLLFGGFLAQADITDVRVVGNGEPTRITIWSDAPQEHAVFLYRSDAKQEIILALPGSDNAAEGTGKGGVEAWTLRKGQLKFHLDRSMMVARVLNLPPRGSAPSHRIIIDLQTVSAARFASVARRDQQRMARYRKAPVQSAQASAPPPTPLDKDARLLDARYRIVIDPGHGGKDPGALAVNGGMERDITLSASQMLKALLEEDPRYQVKLTRDTDVFIELEERVNIARGFDADLFISIHADAAANKSVAGASVYTISSSGEKRIDKVSSKHKWKLPIEDGTSKQVGGILEDLIKRETKTRSAEFAEMLLPELAAAGPVLRDTHRNAGFYVLLAPDVPAVLLELGFLTNAKDAKRLKSKRGRLKAVKAVKRGIDVFFDSQDVLLAQYSPAG